MFVDFYKFPVSDQALMFPMMEMAREKICCISEVLYIYNVENPISDYKTSFEKQQKVEKRIMQMPRYEKEESL